MLTQSSERSLTHGFFFADLRGYTSFVETQGDRAGAALLAEYRSIVRDAVARYDGAEIRTEGDGFFVVFPSASSAVDCALAVVASVASRPPSDRPMRIGVGVHAGETIQTAEGLVGSAVNIAARICAQAGAGEVLVSDTVRSLTRTVIDATFEPVGTRRLKGVTEPMTLYRVLAPGVVSDRRRPRYVRRSVRAILAAMTVAVLVLAIAAATLLSGNSAGPSATTSPSVAAVASPATSTGSSISGPPASTFTGPQADLLYFIPLEIQPNCRPARRADGGLSGLASFRCDLQAAGADTVWFDRFGGSAEVNVAFADFLETAGELPIADCSPSVSRGKGQWKSGINVIGKLACGPIDAAAWITWTYDSEKVVARADRGDGDWPELFAWWDEWAGLVRM
jgi:class 3 adenylate cyclase